MSKFTFSLLLLLFSTNNFSQITPIKNSLKFIFQKKIIDSVPFGSSKSFESKLVNTSNKEIEFLIICNKNYNAETLYKSFIAANDTLIINWESLNFNKRITSVELEIKYNENGEYNETKNHKSIYQPIGTVYVELIKYDNTKTINLGDINLNSIIKREYTIRPEGINYIEIKKQRLNSIYWKSRTLDERNINCSFSEEKIKFSIELQNIWGNKGQFIKKYRFRFREPIEDYILTVTGNFTGKIKDTTLFEVLEKPYHKRIYKLIYRNNLLDSLYIPSEKELIENNVEGPIIKFDSLIANYGVVNKGGNGTRYFTFTNIGDKPLVITAAKSSCGCLVASWPREPILPGGKGRIKATYATNRIGRINKSITIYSNAINGNRKTLRIKGEVLPPKNRRK